MNKIKLPKVIFGTSGLGNLYVALPEEEKLSIVRECLKCSSGPVVFDTAGKYGAGLALETLGSSLEQLEVDPAEVLISNKLGWLRTALKTDEPTFEPGIWKNISHDAIQQISYDGILECYEQGNELLGNYHAALVSVHDPDEYLAASKDEQEWQHRYQDILDAYRALHELKLAGKVKAIGVGAKDWRIIERIAADVTLDWVMIANSMTIHSHPLALVDFMLRLKQQDITIINSSVFNGGFLTGAAYYNYRLTDPVKDESLYRWREQFYQLCMDFNVTPVAACVVFGMKAPGVRSIALNTTQVKRVSQNIALPQSVIPEGFWRAMEEEKLIDAVFASRYL